LDFYCSLPATAALRYVAKQLKTVLLISNELVPSCIEAKIEAIVVGLILNGGVFISILRGLQLTYFRTRQAEVEMALSVRRHNTNAMLCTFILS